MEEVFDGGLVTPVPKSTLYDSMRAGSYTAVFESLQARLKTRDGIVYIYLLSFLIHFFKIWSSDIGEVAHLQQELQNQERSRDSLAKELAEMINSNHELNHRLDRLETLLQEYGGLKTKYNALLQVMIITV